MQSRRLLTKLLARVHKDEAGSVSLETLLILGAIALPVLVFTLKFGWPRIRDQFTNSANDLEAQANKVTNGQ